jgi:ribosomal protein S18 acetylase RimI-like enzyme
MKRANIDFIVVDTNFRRQGLANVLMHHAHTWAIDNKYYQIIADTQKENTNACTMYEKFDYAIEKIENFYHFWL